MGMGFAPTWLHQVSPLLHMTTLTTYEGRKPMASWRRPPGRPRNVWLNKVQEDANALLLSTLWRSEIVCHGSWSGATVHSDYATTTMMMKDDLYQTMEGKTNVSRHVQAVRNWDC